MALQLGGASGPQIVIGVDVEGNAKRELASIETSIRRVEGSARSAATPITKAAEATDEWAAGTIRLSEAADKGAEALAREMVAITREDGARELAKRTTVEHTTATNSFATAVTAATTATGLSTVSLATLTAGLGAAAIASTALASVIIRSTQHYFEHAEATRDSREALADLAEGWDRFQMQIGGAVLGNDFSIVRPVQALNAALILSGTYISARIAETRMWATTLMSIPGVGGAIGAADWLFSTPGTTPGDINLAFERARDPRTGMTQDQFTAEARISALHAELRRQADAAKDAQRALEKHNLEVQRFWAGVSPGWTGLTSMVGTSVGLPEWAAAGGIGPWMSGLAPGARTGMYGSENSGNPFAADNAIPLPLWVQAMARSSGLDIYQYWDQHGGGPEERPGFWARGGSFGHGANIAQQFGQGGFAGWSGAALAGIGAGMDFWDQTGSGSTASRAFNGMMTGASIGSIVPGIGTAIGAGVGALVGAIRGWMAPTEYDLRVRQEQQDRESATQMLASDPWLGSNWNALGGNMPFNFDFLKTQVQHDPSAVQGYLDDMVAKTERLNAAMERYGISWENLGEQARQSQIDQMAATLIEDFQVLTLAGADVDFVIEKMSGSVNDFVQAAMRTGSEVPAAMRPMIQHMIDMGLLTDANGNAFEDLEATGINFALTMTEGFDSIAQAIDHLAIALGFVPDRLRDIESAAQDAGAAMNGVRAPGDSAQSPDYMPGRPEMPGSRPERSPEAAMMARRLTPRTLEITVPVSIDGQPVTEAVARYLLAG